MTTDLDWQPLSQHPDWVAEPVAQAAELVPSAQVALIDENLADTAEFCERYGVDPAVSANCVVVTGKRGERVTTAAVMVLAIDRADINKTVRKHLDVRKVSFTHESDAEQATGMRHGGITPVGLPDDWSILVDSHVLEAGEVVIGGGVRGAKLKLDAHELMNLPGAEELALALPRG